MMQRVAISGVTGFVGSGLPALLSKRGCKVTGISRSGEGNVPHVDAWQAPQSMDLAGHSAVIHLSGEPIDQRWNEKTRKRLRDSRIETTRGIVDALAICSPEERPKVLVNASAVGIYGDRGDELLTEISSAGSGFLADLCSDWEKEAAAAEKLGVRVVMIRIGIVLGKDGSAFKKLLRVFKCGIGGKLGSGKQWMPWIHVDDLRAAMIHALDSETLRGPVNGTAPTPERNVDFTRKLASSLHRPAVMPVPGFALKLVLGDFAEALLAGQRAVPANLEHDGFVFQYPTLESALADLTE